MRILFTGGYWNALSGPILNNFLPLLLGKHAKFKDLPIRKTLLIFSLTQQYLFSSNCSFSLLSSFETHSASATLDCPAGSQFPALSLHVFIWRVTQSSLETDHLPFLMRCLETYHTLQPNVFGVTGWSSRNPLKDPEFCSSLCKWENDDPVPFKWVI